MPLFASTFKQNKIQLKKKKKKKARLHSTMRKIGQIKAFGLGRGCTDMASRSLLDFRRGLWIHAYIRQFTLFPLCSLGSGFYRCPYTHTYTFPLPRFGFSLLLHSINLSTYAFACNTARGSQRHSRSDSLAKGVVTPALYDELTG